MTRKERAEIVEQRLEDLYPETPIPLDHTDTYTLLIAVLLSAQCTDIRVNLITPKLFARADNPVDMSTVPVDEIRATAEAALGPNVLREMKVSPGGDKITLRVSGPVHEQQLREALEAGGAHVRSINALTGSRDPRYEAQLVGVADELTTQLSERFGERAPAGLLRVEWVGPKAGEQLRDAAIQSLLYAIAFIMLYVAFRFDLRFDGGATSASDADTPDPQEP